MDSDQHHNRQDNEKKTFFRYIVSLKKLTNDGQEDCIQEGMELDTIVGMLQLNVKDISRKTVPLHIQIVLKKEEARRVNLIQPIGTLRKLNKKSNSDDTLDAMKENREDIEG